MHARGEQFSSGVLWPKIRRYAFDTRNAFFTELSLEYFEARIGPYLPLPEQMGIPPNTGRLRRACTGDGKSAIGNYVNQRLLYPVHQWLAKILKSIPMDGTFRLCYFINCY